MINFNWENLTRLVGKTEGAAYVLDLEEFRLNVDFFLGSFAKLYPNTRLGYSYKTNYLPRLCIEANRLGMYAEVVSGMEYEIAVACGVPQSRIIFNGPAKSRSELLRAFRGGALVNVDNLGEANLIANIADQVEDRVRLGLRCNLDLQWRGQTSRFGLSDSNGDLQRAYNLLLAHPKISIEGLHCHFSFDRTASSYRSRAEKLCDLADSLFTQGPPMFLDIGGGFCGPMPETLKAQFSNPPPDAPDYAKAISEVLNAHYAHTKAPELILEPGVGLVGNVLDYVCRIDQVKRLSGRTVAITSGATHDMKIVPNDYNPPLTLFSDPACDLVGASEPVDLVGYTCLEHDILFRGYEGHVRPGDIAVFGNVGAYSMVTSPTFIRSTPPVVMLATSGDWKVLKSRLTVPEFMAFFTL